MSTRSIRHILILMRSKRKFPATLEHHVVPPRMQLIIQSDPTVYADHKKQFRGRKNIRVVEGVPGLSPQSAFAYHVAKRAGHKWFFRIDDDILDRYYKHRDGRYVGLEEVIKAAWRASQELDVSLVGFLKTANKVWLRDEPSANRTYSLVHGASALFRVPSDMKTVDTLMNPRLPLYDDVWQSLSHREECGAVARVQYIGLDLTRTLPRTVTAGADVLAKHRKSRTMLLKAWPDYITCDTKVPIPAKGGMFLPWRFKRHPDFQKTP